MYSRMTRHNTPSCETQPYKQHARERAALRGPERHHELLLEPALLARRRAGQQPLDRHRLGSAVPMSERAAVHRDRTMPEPPRPTMVWVSCATSSGRSIAIILSMATI